MVLGILWGHLAGWAGETFWWQNPAGFSTAAWWINSTILFYVGMLFARFEPPIAASFFVFVGCCIAANGQSTDVRRRSFGLNPEERNGLRELLRLPGEFFRHARGFLAYARVLLNNAVKVRHREVYLINSDRLLL